MKRKVLLLFMFLAVASTSIYAQNVGVGIAAPTQKLHVSDGTSPNTATIRVSGLSSTTALAAGTAPFSVVIVDDNGVMYRGGTVGAGNQNAWYTLGNAGTIAGTNFIGTLDNQAFVVKTNGGAATNERMRILATGPGVYNNTTAFSGDVFSVYGTGYTGAINALGGSAINGYVGGNGIGVYGESNSATTNTGVAVWGNLIGTQTPASSSSLGVYGINNTAPQGAGATAAAAYGVYGEATGNAGTAVVIGTYGRTTSTTGAAYGVYGRSVSNGGGIGTVGIVVPAAVAAGQNARGVQGQCNVAPTGTGYVGGVFGFATGATGTTYGVYGQVGSATGFGVDGVNTNASGTGGIFVGNNMGGSYLAMGSGAAITGNQVGTYSLGRSIAAGSQGIGVVGVGNNLTSSIYTPTTGAGVVGVGQYYGVMGFATTTVNTNGSNNAAFNATNASAGGYFQVEAGGTANTWAYVAVRDNTSTLRKIIGPGTVNTIVPDVNGKLVTMSCPEAPENFFQDYGTGRLVNGRTHINLDPIFAKNIVVNQEHPLRVFIQLEGDCKGVYVTNKTQNGFDVIELDGGTSNVPFTWTVTANRADETNPDGTIARYSSERFVPALLPIPKNVQEIKEVPRIPDSDIEVKIPNDNLPVNKTEMLKNQQK